MNIVRVPLPSDGNPEYPLPADYHSLTADGQRLARINACRQWILPQPSDFLKGEARVASHWFFDRYYLWPDGDYNPFFYPQPPLETPSFHWDQIRRWAVWRLNLDIDPRGSGKTTNICRDILLSLVSHPAYSIAYCTSTHDNARHTGQVLKDQVYENSRIFDDWAPEYEGRMKPMHGEAPKGVEYFYLNNSSWVRCVSVETRQRGLRVRRYKIDDPEYDKAASTSMVTLRENLAELLFHVVLPMVMHGDAGADWTATYVSKRHYAFQAMQVKDGPSGKPVAVDPRFNFWSRMHVSAAREEPRPDGSSRIVSCWPRMWPATIADKEADPTLASRVSLEEIKEIIGTPAFNNEYLGNPGAGDTAYFPALTEEKHGWSLEVNDDRVESEPWRSSSLLTFTHRSEKIRIPLQEFCRKYPLFITADTSYTSGPTSDYKACAVLAIDPSTNLLFALDLWSARCTEEVLARKIFELGDRWHASTVHPEIVRESVSLYETLSSMARTRATEELGFSFIPTICNNNRPGTMQKESKIGALLFRFEHALLKLPLWKTDPPWIRLRDQIDSYNPEVDGGGVPHDDELDLLAMSRHIIKGRLRTAVPPPVKTPTLVDRLLSGETVLPGGAPIAAGIDWSTVSPDVFDQIIASRSGDSPDGSAGPTRA